MARRPAPAAGDARGEKGEKGERLARLTPLHELPDASVRLLVLDAAVAEGTVPWPRLARALAPGALVVSLSPFRSGLAEHAGILFPGPAALEAPAEVEGPREAPVASLAVAPALLRPPAGAVAADAAIRGLAAAAGLPVPGAGTTVAERVEARIAALHASRRGRIFDPATGTATEVASLESAAKLKATFEAGGCWTDAREDALPVSGYLFLSGPEEAASLSASLDGALAGQDVGRVNAWPAPCGREAAVAAPSSPLLTKLSRETALHPGSEPTGATRRA